MSDTREMASGISGKARRWGMRLCLAGDANRAHRVLRRALLDLGFATGDTALAQAGRDGPGTPDPTMRLRTARQGLAPCQDDFSARGQWNWSALMPPHDSLEDVRFLAFLYATLYAGQRSEPDAGPDAPEPTLTPKQIECLRWAAAGKGYHDIAGILGISERTVRFHLNGARDQYGFATITQTIVQAAKSFDLDPLDAR